MLDGCHGSYRDTKIQGGLQECREQIPDTTKNGTVFIYVQSGLACPPSCWADVLTVKGEQEL